MTGNFTVSSAYDISQGSRPALERCIKDQCVEPFSSRTKESYKITLAKNSVRVVAVAVGFIGNVTFIPVVSKPAGDNLPYKICLITSSIVGFGSFTTWLLLKIVNEVMKSSSPEEKRIMEGQISRIARISSLSLATIMGTTSLMPTAFITYAYSNGNPAYPIVFVLSNASVPIYSMKLTNEGTIKNFKRLQPIEKEIFNVKNKLVSHLNFYLADFLKKSKIEKLSLIQEIEQLQTTYEENHNPIIDFISKIFEQTSPNQQIPPSSKNTKLIEAGKWVSAGLSLPLSYSLLAHHWVGGKSWIEEFSDNEAGATAFAAFATFCNIYVTLQMLSSPFISGYNSSVEISQRRYTPTLATQLMPVATITSKVVAAAIGAFGYGGALPFSQDYFPEGGYGEFITYASSIAYCLMITGAMFSIVEEAIPAYVRKSGSPEEKQIALFHQKIQNLIALIDKCSLQEFAKFLLASTGAPYMVTLQANLTEESIRAYLATLEQTRRQEEAPLLEVVS